ncbi:hypothetical protein D6856_06700 [Butyrivibrio sp. XB500-5]|uniref:hypothetical protein n=1 Tax=Butyrivibrio sp. XB500-5 TaxID=2364880 RepID=UPI000EA9415B|nr:hypothetical protein [Butyrivibrio sp. XB500-5]RKM60739.1 hypothetical protein D6856_06700 [Butyrivibrio sp. XB500-5]
MKKVFAFMAISCLMLSACGNSREEQVAGDTSSTEDVSAESSIETYSNESASGEASSEDSSAQASADISDINLISDEGWRGCYFRFLKELDGDGQFSLFDLDNDGIPELFLDTDSKGTKEIYAYDESSNTVKTTDVYCGYHTSGSIMLRQIKDTNYFITGPAFSEDTVLYKFENGEAKQIVGCGVGADDKPYYYSDSFEKEISKEEFEKTFKDNTGIEWTATLPGLKGDLGLTGYLSKDLSDDSLYSPVSEAEID